MLTDIFANRYADRPIWTEYTGREQKLIVQMFRIVKEQVIPYWTHDGKANELNQLIWKSVESQLSMELGKKSLSAQTYGFYNKTGVWMSGTWSFDHQCETWMNTAVEADVDVHMKERVSFTELAFRQRETKLLIANVQFQKEHVTALLFDKGAAQKYATQGLRAPGSRAECLAAQNKQLNDQWATTCHELNVRFQQAKAPLSYHNGFVQIAKDQLIEAAIAKPFWALTSEPMWANVDNDMKEAMDRREANDRDPAFYAMRALESAIKIISDVRGFTTGNEKGASNYIDNLIAEKNGRFVEVWEGEQLKALFRHIRNPLGHGPGAADMAVLSQQQTDWAIDAAMSWTRNLIKRL